MHPLRAGVRGGGGSSQDQSSSSQKQAGAHLEEEPKWEFKAVHGWLARVALSVKARVGNQAEGASHAGSPPSLRSPRLSPKHRDDGRKTGSQRSSGSRSPSPSGGSGWGSPQQNGGSRQRSGAHGGRPGSAHSPPDVRRLGFAEGSPLPLSRAAPCGVVAGSWRGGAVNGSQGDPFDTLSLPSPPLCSARGIGCLELPGMLGWMLFPPGPGGLVRG